MLFTTGRRGQSTASPSSDAPVTPCSSRFERDAPAAPARSSSRGRFFLVVLLAGALRFAAPSAACGTSCRVGRVRPSSLAPLSASASQRVCSDGPSSRLEMESVLSVTSGRLVNSLRKETRKGLSGRYMRGSLGWPSHVTSRSTQRISPFGISMAVSLHFARPVGA